MHTVLDYQRELELNGLKYDGHNLVAEVVELVIGHGRSAAPGVCRYLVIFPKPRAHALTEEFPAVVAQWVQGQDTGFLRRIENPSLRAALGVDLEQFDEAVVYALITAHEILVVCCNEEPSVAEQAV